ncbi:alpha/beta fold hydrolase [Amycolatopsis sp. PS_44_ISF1]|uniref:alpha/beta hydrolase family protein n=1 Tax=Amycolatopsis sp. PS_44_ISF1 TaxID=2974917 RepID=UPI0028DE9F57|nr:alpha/beta fold hydrolase [Amycolatopsis sp. PS_44_ISF1]MDT8910220.1 esterase FrsA [Amycolatopsis sp. PS_44_ISF1]
MKFLFDDESFSFEALRAAGFAAYGGADLGEVLATGAKIDDGDEAAWHASWKATAERVEDIGRKALAAGHEVSAREALLRASNYYRTAEFYLREHPATDPEVTELSRRSHDTFAEAAALLDTPVEAVEIPYEGTTLPGYLFLVDGSGTPRPTVVYNSGYDSTLEEAYFALAAAALRRGYNVLAFDGPGQGATLRRRQLVFRPDWEAVITPVIDYAVRRPEVDDQRISVFGYSLGGYLVARAAAFEPRIAALILDDGVHDFHAAFDRSLPPMLTEWINDERDDVADAVMGLIASQVTQVRWALNNGKWTLGVGSAAALVRRSRDYTLTGIADRITAPTLIMDAENDQFFRGQPQEVQAALVNADTTLVTLTEAEGAGEHCHMGAMGRSHQVMFDWLDETLATA